MTHRSSGSPFMALEAAHPVVVQGGGATVTMRPDNHSDRRGSQLSAREAPKNIRSSGSSPIAAMCNFLKGMFGAGILGIPSAFKQTGIVWGVVLYMLVGLTCTAFMVILIYVKHELQKRELEYDEFDREQKKGGRSILRTLSSEALLPRKTSHGISTEEISVLKHQEVPQVTASSPLLAPTSRSAHAYTEDGTSTNTTTLADACATSHVSASQHGYTGDEESRGLLDGGTHSLVRDHMVEDHTLGINSAPTNDGALTGGAAVLPSYTNGELTDVSNAKNLSDDDSEGVDEEHMIQTYAEVGEAVAGRTGRYIVEAHVVVLEWALCAGFVIVGFDNYSKAVPGADRLLMAITVAPILTALSWIKKIKDLWIVSALGLLVYLVGIMGVSYYEGFSKIHEEKIVVPEYEVTLSSLISFMGAAVYSLEGVNLVLPIETSLADHTKAPRVIGVGTVIYTCVCCLFGSFAFYVGLGTCEADTSIVTDCLHGETARAVRLTLCIALLFTHSLTLFPATEIVERKLYDPADQSRKTNWQRRLVRTGEVLLTVIIGYFTPDFTLFAELIGALMMSTVGFIIPSIFAWKVFGGGRVWLVSDAWDWLLGKCRKSNTERLRTNSDASDTGAQYRSTAFAGMPLESHNPVTEPGFDGAEEAPYNAKATGEYTYDSAVGTTRKHKFSSIDDPRIRNRSRSMSHAAAVHTGQLDSLDEPDEKRLGTWGKLGCAFGVFFGFFVMVIGTYGALSKMVEKF